MEARTKLGKHIELVVLHEPVLRKRGSSGC